MFDDVFCVVVTYGNRGNLVKQVVEAALGNRVGKVIIVDNDSSVNSKRVLGDLDDRYDKVKIVTCRTNLGSAGGFRLGYRHALDLGAKFVFSLDDDNLLENNGVVEKLMSFWKRRADNPVLFCFRHYDEPLLLKSDRDLKIQRLEKSVLNVNSFCYFSLTKMFSMIAEVFKWKVPNKRAFYELPCGAYGGLFCHRSVFELVGFPDESFYLYYDDIEMSYRMFNSCLRLFMLPDCKIIDLDFTLANKSVRSYFSVFNILENIKTMNELKFKFSFKNRVRLEARWLVRNGWLYYLNKALFFMFVYPFAILLYYLKYGEANRMLMLYDLIKEGEKLR